MKWNGVDDDDDDDDYGAAVGKRVLSAVPLSLSLLLSPFLFIRERSCDT